MSIETSLILVKPDGVQRGLVGEIVTRIEKTGLQLSGMKLLLISREMASDHYGEHKDKPFFGDLVDYITSSPVVALAISGPNAVAKMRSIIGVTDPQKAQPGTIRGDLGLEINLNLIHGSANIDDAKRELKVFFKDSEVLSYQRQVATWISGSYSS